jgi:hypothetical protein
MVVDLILHLNEITQDEEVWEQGAEKTIYAQCRGSIMPNIVSMVTSQDIEVIKSDGWDM